MAEAGHILPIVSGSAVVLGLLKPIRRLPVDRLAFLLHIRLKQRKNKRWSMSRVSLRETLSKFWSVWLVWGRVGWVRNVGGTLRLGLYTKCRKQLIYTVIFVEARNVILQSVLRLKQPGRKVLSFVIGSRLKKTKRVFPLRRMNRKFKNVK